MLFADGTQKKSVMLPTTKRASGPHCPCVLECLGARSARRIAHAAFPALPDTIIQRLVRIPEARGCSEELKSVGNWRDHHRVVGIVHGSQTAWGNMTRLPFLHTMWCCTKCPRKLRSSDLILGVGRRNCGLDARLI